MCVDIRYVNGLPLELTTYMVIADGYMLRFRMLSRVLD